MGSFYNKRRVQFRISDKTKVDNNTSVKSQQQTSSDKNSNSRNDCQRSIGTGQRSFNPGVLQPNIRGPEGIRGLETSDRFKGLESSFVKEALQDGNCSVNKEVSLSRDVGIFNRSKRCLLPCPHTQSVKEIPENCLQSESVPVQSPSFWSSLSPLAIHKDFQTARHYSQEVESTYPSISGRLVGKQEQQGNLCQRQKQNGSTNPRDGLYHQLQEVRAGTFSGFQFCRDPLRSKERDSQTYRGEVREDKIQDPSFPKQCFSTSNQMAKSTWSFEQPGVVGAMGQDSYQENPSEPLRVLVSSGPFSGVSSTYTGRDPEGSEVVARSFKCVKRHRSSSTRSRDFPLHGRLPSRLGSSFRGKSVSGFVDSSGKSAPHKCPGIKSSEVCPTGAKPTIQLDNIVEIRQQYGSGIPQQTGRYKVRPDARGDNFTVRPTTDKGLEGESKVSTRVTKCTGRCFIQNGSDSSIGVVPSSSSSRGDFSQMGKTPFGHVCDQVEQQAPNLCISSSRSRCICRRCPVHGLEQSQHLCVPSNFHSDQNNGENPDFQLQGHTDSSSLANSTLVHPSAGAISRTPIQTPSQTQSTETVREQCVPFKPRSSKTSCLEIAKQSLKEEGFSEHISNRILGPQRDSTKKVYRARWWKHCDWCKEQHKHPLSTTIPLLAEFLNFLFTEMKFRPGTIEGYKTAIADHLRFCSEIDINNNIHIANLIKSFHKDQPRKKDIFPRWNLALVLNHLSQAPFEPLATAPIKYVTWKTAFLTLLASGSRCSEVHALEYMSLKFQEKYLYATIEPVQDFKAKTANKDSRSQRMEYIKIPALSPSLERGLTEDKSLCPVRALKVYRSRTAPLRKDKNMRKLFISFRPNFDKDICKNTFSSWIRSTIQHAYNNVSKHTISVSNARPHEVRALAASVAWKANVNLSDILAACSWKHHTTFTQFYLRDISMIQDDIHFLGPIVAAQHIVQI